MFKPTSVLGFWFVNVKKPYIAIMDDFGNLVMAHAFVSNVISDN